MTQLLVWWQAYKAALSGPYPGSANDTAKQAVLDYISAKNRYGKELA